MVAHNSPGVPDAGLHLLVLRCQIGDEVAFARLMDQYGDRTLRYLRGLVGEAAEDVQQEVWLTVYRRIATLARPTAFRTWLFRTTRHRALDHLRKEKREHELIDDAPIATVDVAAECSDSPLTDSLLDALDRLGAIHREVLQLRYRDDMPYAEIALVMGCSVGTVRSRLHHARQRLQAVVTQGDHHD